MIGRERATIVASRCDWLTIAFRVTFPGSVLTNLRERGELAGKHGAAACLFGGEMWMLKRKQAGAFFQLMAQARGEQCDVWPRGQGAEISVTGEVDEGFTLVVHFSGVAMANRAPSEWVERAWTIARSAGEVREARVRRLDLACDVVGAPTLDELSLRGWLRAAKRTKHHHETDTMAERGARVEDVSAYPLLAGIVDNEKVTQHGDGRITTGWVFGRGGDIHVRMYDKIAQLQRDKAPLETELWTVGGWQAGEGVSRVEVQLRGSAIDELCHRCEARVECVRLEEQQAAERLAMLAMMVKLNESIDGCWQYATRNWLRYIDRDSSERASRCKTAPWWEVVQSCHFVRRGALPLVRSRRGTAVKSAQVLGAVLSLATHHGVHSPIVSGPQPGPVHPVQLAWWQGNEHDTAQHMFAVGYAEEYLRDIVRLGFEAAERVVIDDLLLSKDGAKGALEHVLVKWNAHTASYAPAAGVVKAPRERRDSLSLTG